jgi:hypothetical protein
VDRLNFFTKASPVFMNILMAVGAVYRIDTPYFSIMDHQRPRSGKSGEPSYSMLVAPRQSGPYTT